MAGSGGGSSGGGSSVYYINLWYNVAYNKTISPGDAATPFLPANRSSYTNLPTSFNISLEPTTSPVNPNLIITNTNVTSSTSYLLLPTFMSMHYPNAITTLSEPTTWSWRVNTGRFFGSTGTIIPTLSIVTSTPRITITTGICSTGTSVLYPVTPLTTLGDGNNYNMVRLFFMFDSSILI